MHQGIIFHLGSGPINDKYRQSLKFQINALTETRVENTDVGHMQRFFLD